MDLSDMGLPDDIQNIMEIQLNGDNNISIHGPGTVNMFITHDDKEFIISKDSSHDRYTVSELDTIMSSDYLDLYMDPKTLNEFVLDEKDSSSIDTFINCIKNVSWFEFKEDFDEEKKLEFVIEKEITSDYLSDNINNLISVMYKQY